MSILTQETTCGNSAIPELYNSVSYLKEEKHLKFEAYVHRRRRNFVLTRYNGELRVFKNEGLHFLQNKQLSSVLALSDIRKNNLMQNGTLITEKKTLN